MKKLIALGLSILCIAVMCSGCFSNNVAFSNNTTNNTTVENMSQLNNTPPLNDNQTHTVPAKAVINDTIQAKTDEAWITNVTQYLPIIIDDEKAIDVNSSNMAAVTQLQADTHNAINATARAKVSYKYWETKQDWDLGLKHLNMYSQLESYRLSIHGTGIDENEQKAMFGSGVQHLDNVAKSISSL
jgi:hypothetical protein